MALPTNRNLGDLRLELSARLGFASTGNASGPKQAVLNSFLQNAQDQLYYAFDWKQLKKVFTFNASSTPSLGQSQQYIDYPDDVNPDRILEMSSKGINTTDFDPMQEGIDLSHRNTTTTDRPRRYALRDQIEIWPVTDQSGYTIRMEYIKRLSAFTQDSHATSLPVEKDGLIFLHALANAKGHYRHPDAQAYAGQLNTFLGRLRSKESPNSRYIRGVFPDSPDPYYPRPVAQGGISSIV